MKNNIILTAVIVLLSVYANAQDYIRTKTDTIKAKVEEIGIDEIKYKSFDNLNGPLIVIEKTRVLDITYENGKKEIFESDNWEASKEIDVRHKRNAIKFEFLAPLTNDIAFGYETMLKVGTNLEFKVGIIGPGLAKTNDDVSGYFVKAGVKFLLSPTYYVRGVKYAHGLKGGYIKPELIYNSFNMNGVNFYNGAVNIVFGKQHVLGNIITLDYYAGLGYGLQSNDYVNPYPGYPYEYDFYQGYVYSHTYGGPDFPIVLSGGLTIGVIF